MLYKLDTHCPLSVRVDALEASVFPPPSLKFRTSGFPQYGFKLEFSSDLRQRAPGLSARPTFPCFTMTYTLPQLSPQDGAAQWANRKGIVTIQAVHHPSCENDPVQRPLARRRVMLSRRVAAYYGLIRRSRTLRSIYGLIRTVLARRSCLGWLRELPQFTLRDCPCVPPSVPRWTGRLPVVVASPPVLAFAQLAQARRPRPAHAGSRAESVTRLQSSLHAAARRLVSPSPTRAFTFELSPPGVAPTRRRIWLRSQTTNCYGRTYTGKSRSLMGCKLICADLENWISAD
jgi:hypothetical protein